MGQVGRKYLLRRRVEQLVRQMNMLTELRRELRREYTSHKRELARSAGSAARVTPGARSGPPTCGSTEPAVRRPT